MAAYVDSTGVTNLTADIKALADATYVNSVSYDIATGKITKTIGSTTTDVVGVATSSTNGLMSFMDRAKLDNIPAFTLIGQI